MSLWRIRPGELVVGTAGIVLFVSLFLDWYETGARRPGGTQAGGLNAWESFAVLDMLLVGTALAALAVTILTAHRAQALAMTVTSLTTLFAGLTTVFVLVRLAFPPGSADDGGREVGVYVGVAACLALTGGLFYALRDERVGGRGYRGGERVERLPAPSPDGEPAPSDG